MTMQGKIVLVTGGAGGVGSATVRAFVQRGADVIIHYRTSAKAARALQAELAGGPGRIELVRGSVADPAQVEALFAEVEAHFGGLDVLVNNAASGKFEALDAVSDVGLDRSFDAGFRGALYCGRHALPLLRKRGGGAIVNVSSIGADLVIPNYLGIGAAKAALEALTRYQASEYARDGVRVNAASAGFIETEVIRHFPNFDHVRSATIAATPLGRLGRPEELAAVVVFLASQEASWITGQTLLADGGLSLRAWCFGDLDLPKTARTEMAPVLNETVMTDSVQRSPVVSGRTPTGGSGEGLVAIVGVGVAVPGASSAQDYWRILLEGPDLFRSAPPDRWTTGTFFSVDRAAEDKNYSTHGAFVDASDDGANLPRDAAHYEFSGLWLRRAVTEALGSVRRRPEDRYELDLGFTPDGNQSLEEAFVVRGMLRHLAEVLEKKHVPAAEREALLRAASRALYAKYRQSRQSPAQFLSPEVARRAVEGILPPSTGVVMIDTACSSSLYSIDLGLKSITMGYADIAVCGGAMSLAPLNGVLFAKLGGLTKQGELRAFDARGDGVLFADGAVVVVLKSLARARADGDGIHGVIRGFGASSDGKGKAIYAPSVEGQAIAVRRAYEGNVEVGEVDWVLAHGTGTPAGDLTEWTALRNTFGQDRERLVTSNKSVIGHTGWAAGAASVVQSVLGLEHDMIPPQHRFDALSPGIDSQSSSLTVPKIAQSWTKKSGTPRVAACSAFGFGGTNAHLVISDDAENLPNAAHKPEATDNPRMAIVAWSAAVPGVVFENGVDPGPAVDAWLANDTPEASFGERFPSPPFERIRMPPRALRTLDRTQVMAVECVHELRRQIGDSWDELRDRTGVFVGHMGKTGHALLYGQRVYLDDVGATLRADPELAASPHLESALADVAIEAKRRIPASNEDSYPGLMPNVIAARAANFFDLHGPTMAVDTGFASSHAALRTGMRYLRTGDIDLLVAGGINGSVEEEFRTVVEELVGDAQATLGEAAVLFALVRPSTAQKLGLRVLGYVDAESTPTTTDALVCGSPESNRGHRYYLGAEGAVGLLRALRSLQGSRVVRCAAHGAEPADALTLHASLDLVPSPAPHGKTPAHVLTRQQLVWADAPAMLSGLGSEWFQAGTLVLTDSAATLAGVAVPAGVSVLAVDSIAADPSTGLLMESAARKALRAVGAIRHLRVLSSLADTHVAHSPRARLIALHDLTFLALQEHFGTLACPSASVIGAVFCAGARNEPDRHVGLFTGLFKSAIQELRGATVFCVVSDTGDVGTALDEAFTESRCTRKLPVAFYDGGARYELALTDVANESSARPIDASSVVVALGGGRGITGEILIAVARERGSKIHVLGRTRIDHLPASLFEPDDAAFAKGRSAFIDERRAVRDGSTIAQISAGYDRLIEARAVHANLARMRAACGADRVFYHLCDARDRERVEAVVREILEREGHVDLLINAAGINRAASIPSKKLADLRLVRDLKVEAYQNLRHAFRDAPPSAWVNFGSFIGFTGLDGETDYAAANDFLNVSSLRAGSCETTICWTTWADVGMVWHDPLRASLTLRSGNFTTMPTREGIEHFFWVLERANPSGCVVLLGAAERARILRHLPDFFTPRAPAAPGFYLDRVIHSAPDEAAFERQFDPSRDGYLKHHAVAGRPTLPGTFVLEIAAEAAVHLVPDHRVVAFEDVVFGRFLAVHDGDEGRPPKRIRARVVERDAHRVVVQVRVVGDIVAANGTVLQRDRLHFDLKVVLDDRPRDIVRWRAWDSFGEEPTPDPYHFAGAPVRLDDFFESTEHTRLHPLGKRADFKRPPSGHPVLSRFIVPSLLLDGLARVAALQPEGAWLPLVAPTRIRRIEIHTPGNDLELSRQHDSIALYATPSRIDFEHAEANRCVAVGKSGQVLVEIKDVEGVVTGYVHRETGKLAPAGFKPRQDDLERTSDGAFADGAGPVKRFVWKPIELAPAAAPPADLRGLHVAVVGGGEDTRSHVASRLRTLGAECVLIVDPAAPLGPIDGIVDLNLGRRLEREPTPDWRAAIERSLAVLHHCYPAWVRDGSRRHFYVAVTHLGGRLGRDGGSEEPLGGIWAGLAKTLPREIPSCFVKVIDVDVDTDLPAILEHELASSEPFEVGYRGGTRSGLFGSHEPAPSHSARPLDTVLISGGARGIGFALAKHLASRCRVVVTGRSERLDPRTAPWLEANDVDFAKFKADRYQAARGTDLGVVRRELTRQKQMRELHTNLEAARHMGLNVEYVACDVTSPEAVRLLVEQLGPRLSAVVHGAGIDEPVRLGKKSAASFAQTVSVKVDGFLNLFEAVRSLDLAFFCNVGSMSGRLGGMIGQTDYSAGNEALSQLGAWAADRVSWPVFTTCWATWQRVGLIANYEAAIEYMSAVRPDEAVRRWDLELDARSRGEICFVGTPAAAVVPRDLYGFSGVSSDFPGYRELATRRRWLGDVNEFEPGRSLVSLHRLEASECPALFDFRVQGAPTVPVSLLLELARAGAEWVIPIGEPIRVTGFSDVRITLDALAAPSETITLERTVTARLEGNERKALIRFGAVDQDGRRTAVATLAATFGAPLASSSRALVPLAADDERVVSNGGERLQWRGQVFAPVRWHGEPGARRARVRPAAFDDVWLCPESGHLALPCAALEALVQSASANLPAAPQLVIRSLQLFGSGREAWLEEDGHERWTVLDDAGSELLAAEGLRIESGRKRRSQPTALRLDMGE